MAEEIKTNPEVKPEEDAGKPEEEQQQKTPSVEELMAELAKERAERAKLKNSFDNASSEAAKYKKALREKQTAEEIQNEEKQKAEEQHKAYVAELEKFKRTAEAKARYALQGMGEELAKAAAEAEVQGDYDALANIQKQHSDALIKAKEAEWLKNRPEISAGNTGGEAGKDPFLAGFSSAF